MDAPIRPSGSGFNINQFNGNRIKTSIENSNRTNYVSLTLWCQNNFISKRLGKTLLAKKLLIGQRLKGKWWVCANPECIEELLDYLGLDQLFFDATN